MHVSLICVTILRRKVCGKKFGAFSLSSQLTNGEFHFIFSEPKLTAAQRIVPEWKDYDSEIKNLLNRVQDQEHDEQVIEPVATESSEKVNSESTSQESKDDAKHTEL